MAVRETQAMIAGMAPALDPESYVFATAADPELVAAAAPLAIATVSEAEGLSLILPLSAARRLDFDPSVPMRRITLGVASALDGVGLTAAVAGRLAEAGTPCNMVAGYHHDHVFVPAQRAEEALSSLLRLASEVEARGHGK